MAETRIIPGVGTVRKNDDGTFDVIAPEASVGPQVSASPLPVNPVRAAKEAQDSARQAEKDRQDAIKFGERNAPNLQAGFRWKNGVVGGEAEPIPGTTNTESGKLAVIPGAAATGIQENISSLRKAEMALAALDAQHGGRPQSIGPGTGALGQYFLNWHDPDGTKTRAAVAAIGAQKIHDLSGAAVSASEAPRFQPFVPTVTDTPDVARDKLTQFRDQLKQQITESVNFYSQANGYRPYTTPAIQSFMADTAAAQPTQHADREIDPVTLATRADDGPTDPGAMPPANMPGGNDPTPPPQSPASGGFKTVMRPEVARKAFSLMAAGAGFATVKSALGDTSFSMADYANAKKRLAADPHTNPFSAHMDVPTTNMEKLAGSGLGAFTGTALNTAFAGLPAYMGGEKGKAGVEAMQAAHPDASFWGGLTGGVAGAMGGEAALAARAPAALAGWAPRAADALFGGVSGYTGSDGDLGSAALGAITAPLAGAAGERVSRAAGGMAKGVTDPAVQFLRSLNIPMTGGQVMGGGVKKVEDALTSIPFVGNAVDRRRMEGFEGLNKAAFDIGAQTTGGQVQNTGAEGLRELDALKSGAYSNALDPVTLNIAGDPAALADISNAQLVAAAIPQVGGPAEDALAYRIGGGMDPSGMMGGRDFQEAYRGLARDGRGAKDAYAHEFQGAMRDGQDALVSTLERQNPGAFQGFQDANAANRRLSILSDAVGRARNTDGDLFTPAQLEAADFANAKKLTGKFAAASGDRPFAELAEAGQKVLPSKLPDSGTSTRALIGYGLASTGLGAGGGYAADGGSGAAIGGSGGGLAIAAALAAGGSKPAQRILTKLLLDRPEWLRAAGSGIQNHAKLGGGFGAGILTPLTVGP